MPCGPGRLLAASLALGLAAAGCERPDHIEIDPRMPRLIHQGETLRLHGKLLDRRGRVFATERPAWASRDPFVAAVDKDGQLAALGSGHTRITARWNELSAEVPVEVDLVEALRAEPAALEVSADGEAQRITVTPLGLDGRPRPDRPVHLASLHPAVARVDPAGRVWGLAAGTAVVKARSDGQEAEIRVTVSESPARRPASAHAPRRR